jgi:hypothetical protein
MDNQTSSAGIAKLFWVRDNYEERIIYRGAHYASTEKKRMQIKMI